MVETPLPRATGSRDGAVKRDRTERVLTIVEKLIRHDFANQLVVMQGLLELLEIDEKDNISAQGMELLRRIKKSAQRTLNMGFEVRDVLMCLHEPTSDLDLGQIMDDFRSRATQAFADCQLVWECAGKGGSLRAGRKTLLLILEELTRLTFSLMSGKSFRMHLQPVSGGRRGLCLRIEPGESNLPMLPARATWEGRQEFLLGREFLTGWGGTLEIDFESGPGVEFVLSFPG